MGVLVNREDLLQLLESVAPGRTDKENIEQSSCVVFQNSLAFTFNDEIACLAPTGLKEALQGAIPGKPLTELLTKIQDEEVYLEQDGEKLLLRIPDKRKPEDKVRFKSSKTTIKLFQKIALPLEQMEYPQEWIPLHEDFLDAVTAVQDCALNKGPFQATCLHIHPKWIEASDGLQIMRFRLPTGVENSLLVRKESIKHITALGMCELGETRQWLHFRNQNQAILSCRRFLEDFPDLTPFLKCSEQEEEITLPRQLQQALERAEILTKELGEKALLEVSLTQNKMKITGRGALGEHTETKKVTYTGKNFAFLISPKTLIAIAKKHNQCFLSEKKLTVKGPNWKYVTRLQQGEKK